MVSRTAQRTAEHGMIAVKPGGEGEVGAGAVLWKEPRGVPEIPRRWSPGAACIWLPTAASFPPWTPRPASCCSGGRLGAGGPYYSSPVAAAGKVYFSSGEGVVTVIHQGDRLEVAARNDLGEPIYATPALVDSKIYIRTTAHLYAFGE